MRKRRGVELEGPEMDTGLIRPFEPLERNERGDPDLAAVLFASGRLVRVDSKFRIFGLVLAGYEGLSFGDDGTHTAKVASELPLEKWDGVEKLEQFVHDGVQQVNPAYCAEFVGRISAEEASVYLRTLTKQEAGEPVADEELRWGSGTLHLS